MNKNLIAAGALLAIAALPTMASAQIAESVGVATGIATGAALGAAAVADGVVGGVVDGVTGGLDETYAPRFRSYVREQDRPAFQYDQEISVGSTLPEAGVTYYEIPAEYSVREYRYTVVNGRTVLVEPRTRRIVQMVD